MTKMAAATLAAIQAVVLDALVDAGCAASTFDVGWNLPTSWRLATVDPWAPFGVAGAMATPPLPWAPLQPDGLSGHPCQPTGEPASPRTCYLSDLSDPGEVRLNHVCAGLTCRGQRGEEGGAMAGGRCVERSGGSRRERLGRSLDNPSELIHSRVGTSPHGGRRYRRCLFPKTER